jgi:hypothetical protein
VIFRKAIDVGSGSTVKKRYVVLLWLVKALCHGVVVRGSVLNPALTVCAGKERLTVIVSAEASLLRSMPTVSSWAQSYRKDYSNG